MRISDWSSDVCSSDLKHSAALSRSETRWLDFTDKAFSRRGMLAAGAVAATIVGAIGLGIWRGQQGIATAIGEVRDVALPDGSVMHLNTGSRVVVAFSR